LNARYSALRRWKSRCRSAEYRPCFQRARVLRSRPSGVRGPVLLPPCIRTVGPSTGDPVCSRASGSRDSWWSSARQRRARPGARWDAPRRNAHRSDAHVLGPGVPARGRDFAADPVCRATPCTRHHLEWFAVGLEWFVCASNGSRARPPPSARPSRSRRQTWKHRWFGRRGDGVQGICGSHESISRAGAFPRPRRNPARMTAFSPPEHDKK
jgi:hypothetical protein